MTRKNIFRGWVSYLGWAVIWLVVGSVSLLPLTVVTNHVVANFNGALMEIRCSQVAHVCILGGGMPMQLAWPKHPENFGRLQALGDLRHGRVKWFQYGLMDLDAFKRRSEILGRRGVKLVAGGCVIGGADYVASMAYNRSVKGPLGGLYW